MEKMIFTKSAYETYERTVAKHEPETGAVLIGDPKEPFVVKEFRFSPPTRLENGEYDHSIRHFALDADYVNWAINNEWGPNGDYVIGFLHSHPRGITELSSGSMDGLSGDIPLLTACLEAPEMKAAGVHQLLAPITPFNADGSDNLHGWMLRRGSVKPERIEIVIEHEKRGATIDTPPVVDVLPDNPDADLIDTLVLRRRAMLDKPGLRFLDRVLARRLYGRVVAQAFADPASQSSRSSFLKIGNLKKERNHGQ